jgi:hypothetical protein
MPLASFALRLASGLSPPGRSVPVPAVVTVVPVGPGPGLASSLRFVRRCSFRDGSGSELRAGQGIDREGRFDLSGSGRTAHLFGRQPVFLKPGTRVGGRNTELCTGRSVQVGADGLIGACRWKGLSMPGNAEDNAAHSHP